ncbi:MAG: hypothetical protein F6K09_38195 [Merismopedia sp. SIO2A8]|nr:hypothetical protein [Merismopedia sp. SIO2A8]
MSAIVGIYYFDGRSVEKESLGKMVDILAHRGSDGASIWNTGSVGLGHLPFSPNFPFLLTYHQSSKFRQ